MQKILNFIKKNKQFSFFFLLVILLIFVAVFAPVIAPQDPYVSDLKNALQAPNSEHWFGTDKLGRDIFSRVIYASRISLPATLTLVAIIFVAGTILGTLAGYFGGWVDAVIMRLSDMMISFPGMVLAIAVAGIMGASIKNAVIAIAIVSWSKYARLARSLVMKIRHEDYVYAAIVTGSKTGIYFKKIYAAKCNSYACNYRSYRHRWHDVRACRAVISGIWCKGTGSRMGANAE